MPAINTKQAARRDLSYASLAELRADVERIKAAEESGVCTSTGNWNAGQCFWHLAVFMKGSLDGFPDQKPPLLLRVLGKYVFKGMALSGKPAKPGIKLPSSVSWLDPVASGVEGLADGYPPLDECLSRVEAGERFTHPSPIFGPLTHEQWVTLHLGHAAMHLSFQDPGPEPVVIAANPAPGPA